jgi:hypothetical protein
MTKPTLTMPRPALDGPLGARRRWTLAAIESLVAVNALGGMAYALGGAPGVPEEWLDDTPFGSYLVPGLYLGVVVGGSSLAAAYATIRDPRRARVAAFGSSAVMVSWIVAQVAVIGYRSALQPLLAATAVAVAHLAVRP